MLAHLVRAYNEAVYETDRDAALRVVQEALASGVTPEEIVFEVVEPAVEEVTSHVTKDPDADLTHHFMTAQIASEVTERMLERFRAPPGGGGRVIIGTASGDLHSLGKRIVVGRLRSMSVDVADVGVNVPAGRFVDEALRLEAQVIAVSAMMVHTATGPEGAVKVRRILRERGLERRLRIVVGGAPFRHDERLWAAVGADAWAPDGLRGARVIVELAGRVKREAAAR